MEQLLELRQENLISDIKIAYITLQFVADAPPLGLASMATYFKRYGDFQNQKVIDVADKYRVSETLKYNPDIVFISANTMHYPKAIAFANKIKAKQNIPIIIGGVHISTFPQSFDPIFEVGCIGEGEHTGLELMQLFKEKKKFEHEDLQKIQGLVYFNEGKITLTHPRKLITPLDNIPHPDRSFLRPNYFNKKTIIHTKTAKRLTGIITSRGCPYKCLFCSTTSFWKDFRINSAQHMADEIEYLIKEYKIESFFIYDDLFTVHKNRLKELVQILKERNLLGKFSINCMGRTDNIDEELLNLLKQLNTDYINFGFESGSDKILQFLKNDQISVETHKKAILLCEKYSIGVQGSLMFGSPGETAEDMQKTLDLIDFMYEHNVNIVWSTITKPLPGTPLWDMAIKEGIITPDIDPRRLSEMNVDPIMKDSKLSLEDFHRLFKEGRKKIRKLELRYWWRKLRADPLHVTWFVMQNFKFIKFFTLDRGEP